MVLVDRNQNSAGNTSRAKSAVDVVRAVEKLKKKVRKRKDDEELAQERENREASTRRGGGGGGGNVKLNKQSCNNYRALFAMHFLTQISQI